MSPPMDRLRRLIPPPEAGGGHRDWAAVEESLGFPLPQDYKDLVDAYGGGDFYGHIGLLVPPPTRGGSDLVKRNDAHMWDLNNLWSVHENRPAELAAVDDLRLVVWADTIDSDSLNWLVRPDESPERWPVVVLHSDLGDCEIYSMTCTEFLSGLFSPEFESEILTEQVNEQSNEGEPSFAPYPITQSR